MISFTQLTSAQDNERHATNEHNELMLHILTTMAEKIHQLELQAATSNELLAQLRDGDGDQLLSFDDRVLEVLDVRSGSARAALQLEETDVQRWMLSAIEENSGEAFSHIEAEIEEKLADFIDTCAFRDAVDEAIADCLTAKIEEILDGILPDAITDALGDPEDIVRKGLRSIL